MNLKKTASFVKKTTSYTKNTALLGKSVAEYWLHYISNRRFPKNQEFYVVYTNMDHSIPFQPNSALDYWLINNKLIQITIKSGDATSGEFFNDIRHAYVDIVKEGCAAFREVPTIMPHFTEHSGHALHVTQALLKPINCSPSLHTAVPFFAYNLGANYFPEKEPGLRQHIGDVVSIIIKTKLHAMIDIAFGMFLSRKAIKDKLGLDYYDLESFFTQEQKSKDKIPYEHIYRMYHEINEIATTQQGEEGKLPKIMERYFQEIGLPRVRREQSNCLYDLEQKVLVYSPELKVGKGLV
jgi:hypothetical protein